jgi:hypothetical protein
MAHAARGLPATPWFAAATGFVVAAGLWIYSPHAELQFPPSAVGTVPCAAHGCGVIAGTGGGALATTKGEKITPPKSTRMSVAQPNLDGGNPAAGLTFGYRVLWQSQGKFEMLFTLSGKHVPRTWKLSFALPGDEIIDVSGAAWHPSGSYGGTASWPVPGSPWPPAAPGPTSGDQIDGRPPGRGFLVVAAGAPVAPTGCSFDRVSCTFS